MSNAKIRGWRAGKTGKKGVMLALIALAAVVALGGAARALLYEQGVGAPTSHITTPILDNFNRPNEDPLNPTNWTNIPFNDVPHQGGDYNFKVISGQIRNDSGLDSNTGIAYWNTPFTGDQEAYYTASSVNTTPEYWVLLNYSAANGYVMKANQNTWTIFRLDGGTQTTLAQVSQPSVQVGDILIGRHEGSRLSFSYERNGTETEVVTASDNTYSGGDIGLMTEGFNYADDFGGGSLHGSGLQLGNLEKGLVGRWPMNGNTKDATPYGSDCAGAFGSGSTYIATDRKGQSNSAYDFEGHYTKCGPTNNPALELADKISLSTWVKPTAFTNSQGGIVSYSNAYGLYTDTNGYVHFAFGSGSITSTSPIALNTWYHIVGNYDGTTMKLYINNVVAASAAFSGTASYTGVVSPFELATYNNSGGRDFYGSIDDVRVYSRALSPAEVQALYHQYD